MGAAFVWSLAAWWLLHTKVPRKCFVPQRACSEHEKFTRYFWWAPRGKGPFPLSSFLTPPSLTPNLINSQVVQVSTYRLVLGVEQETAVFSQILNPKPRCPPPPPPGGNQGHLILLFPRPALLLRP